tara:strand:+ start:174 stop:440 length:267 start_codon:yes stop_codon:yes gene_type:complete
MPKSNIINEYHSDGTKKTHSQIVDEKDKLILLYRKDNLILRDRIFDFEHNIVPVKDELISALKDELRELRKKIVILENEVKNKKPWII